MSDQELERLRAQRDYYRRRWIIHGLHYRLSSNWRAERIARLKARQKDDDETSS